jgi:sensor histidine kinase YesM
MVFGIIATNYYRALITRWRWVEMSIGQLLPRVLLASVVLSILTHLFTAVTFFLLRYDSIMASPTSANVETDYRLFLSLFNVMFVCFFWSVIYFSYHFIENRNRTLKWEATINEFELNRLKSQLNPHFIFNALNSVRALVDENPPKAKQAITQLSNLLRNSLSMDKKKLISLEEEMRTVADYLALETIRFEERLRVRFDIHPGSRQYQVPPMMVQTLVENGIKHGISKLKEGGEITIQSEVVEDQLIVRITNSGHLEEKPKPESGYGLANTLERLRLLYNDMASFRIVNVDPGHVLTEVKLPIQI